MAASHGKVQATAPFALSMIGLFLTVAGQRFAHYRGGSVSAPLHFPTSRVAGGFAGTEEIGNKEFNSAIIRSFPYQRRRMYY